MRRSWLFLIAIIFLSAVGTDHASAGAIEGCSFGPNYYHPYRSEIAVLRAKLGENQTVSEDRACINYEIGTAYHLHHQYKKAIKYYDKALGWYRTFADAYELRGDAYAALGRPDLAAKSYQLVRTATPDSAYGLADRCWMRAIIGVRLKRALADCSASLKAVSEKDDRDQESTRQSICFVYYRMGEYDKALTACNRALGEQPKDYNALYVRGLVELAKGNRSAAKTDIVAALDGNFRLTGFYVKYGIPAPSGLN